MASHLSKQQLNALSSSKGNKTMHFFTDLRKFFLIKEVFFQIDIQKYTYEISDHIFVEKEYYISRDSFYKLIRKIYYCFFYSGIILDEHCSGEEISPSKLSPEFDFSLYS